MTEGLLLDSHLLLWLEQGLPIRPAALLEIGAARDARRLFVSDVSVWELGVAYYKKSFERRPNLRGLTIDAWFREIAVALGLRTVRLSHRIALEAAGVPAHYGSGDPGDCFLIATARVRRLALVTRDAKMIELAARRPEYLTVMRARRLSRFGYSGCAADVSSLR